MIKAPLFLKEYVLNKVVDWIREITYVLQYFK